MYSSPVTKGGVARYLVIQGGSVKPWRNQHANCLWYPQHPKKDGKQEVHNPSKCASCMQVSKSANLRVWLVSWSNCIPWVGCCLCSNCTAAHMPCMHAMLACLHGLHANVTVLFAVRDMKHLHLPHCRTCQHQPVVCQGRRSSANWHSVKLTCEAARQRLCHVSELLPDLCRRHCRPIPAQGSCHADARTDPGSLFAGRASCT